MFPDGVIYEGVSDQPITHRGESGANDSMVPLGDNLLQITERMPENPLTNVLRDFRSYRPTNHREFLEYVQDKSKQVGLKDFALQDPNSAALYLSNVDQIRAFRHRHWNFTKEYIIKHTEHPVATGGSPIVTW
jgi:indoleamine 2,3-dioxygenase